MESWFVTRQIIAAVQLLMGCYCEKLEPIGRGISNVGSRYRATANEECKRLLTHSTSLSFVRCSNVLCECVVNPLTIPGPVGSESGAMDPLGSLNDRQESPGEESNPRL